VNESKLRVLLLYARRVPALRGALVETVGARLGALREFGSERRGIGHLFRWLDRNAYDSLSYVNDWLQAFLEYPHLECKAFNITDFLQLYQAGRAVQSQDLIVVLHSAAGDNLSVLRLLVSALQSRRTPLLIFFGNEYTAMPEKIQFAREVESDFIASQLPSAAADWLYAELTSTRILSAPHGLNPKRFFDKKTPRRVDIGFRGDRYPPWIGDDDRTKLIEWFKVQGDTHGITVDIEFKRQPSSEWNQFLNECHGIIGAESGTAFLERDDRTQKEVERFVAAQPQITFNEIKNRFFSRYAMPVSGKAISSRHFEAIGAKTCQVLLEGHYNGILSPDVHYLSVKKDYSNLSEVIEKFKDRGIRGGIVEAAYDHVRTNHTYTARVSSLLQQITSSVRV
jgi:Glycosyl transferases group 1